MKRVVPNPLTGKSFEYDDKTRTLSIPSVSEKGEVETLVLPYTS